MQDRKSQSQSTLVASGLQISMWLVTRVRAADSVVTKACPSENCRILSRSTYNEPTLDNEESMRNLTTSSAASGHNHPGNHAITHSMIRVDGGEVHVARVGSGFPLLLLHGWPEFWFTWEPVMMKLSQHFEVIAPDLRGFGDSSKPGGPFTSKQHAQDLLAILDHFDFSWVGIVSHDVGGAVAQALAHSQPDRIQGLFFFDFLHPGIGDRFFAVDRLINVWYMFFQRTPFAVDLVTATPASIREYFSFFLRDWAYKKDCFDDVLGVFLENFAKPGNVAGGFDYYKAAMPPRTNPKDGIAPPAPPPILLPTCVRWSQYDKLFDYAWTDTLPQFFPNLDLRQFDDVGHFPHRENPDQAAAYITEFFTRVAAGASE